MHTVWDPRGGYSGLIVIDAVQHHLGMKNHLVIRLYAVHVYVCTCSHPTYMWAYGRQPWWRHRWFFIEFLVYS